MSTTPLLSWGERVRQSKKMKAAIAIALVLVIAIVSVVAVEASKSSYNNSSPKQNDGKTPRQDSGGSGGEEGALPETVTVYAGTYTKTEPWVVGNGKGIHAFSFNTKTLKLTAQAVTSTDVVGTNPTFLTGTKQGAKSVLYAVNEIGEPSKGNASLPTGYVVALATGQDGKLKLLGRQETLGAGSCHVSLNSKANFLAVSNYVGGSVSLFAVEKDGSVAPLSDKHQYSGSSKVNPGRQEAPHMHSTTWAIESNFAFSADLGNDRIAQFQLDESKKVLVANSNAEFVATAPGSGPRHMAFHPNKVVAYAAHELDSTITAYSYDSTKGSLSTKSIQSLSTLPSDAPKENNTVAEIEISKDGQFVYVSNRGHNSIAVFKVSDPKTGKLEAVEYAPTKGKTPRHFLLFRSFMLVANQESNDIQVFKVDKSTGKLTATGNSVECPSCVSLFIASD